MASEKVVPCSGPRGMDHKEREGVGRRSNAAKSTFRGKPAKELGPKEQPSDKFAVNLMQCHHTLCNKSLADAPPVCTAAPTTFLI